MSEPELKVLRAGILLGGIYTFKEPGDTIAWHTHTLPEHNHITIILRGIIYCQRKQDGLETTELLGPGDIIDWELGIPHSFYAGEPYSQLINILKTPFAGIDHAIHQPAAS
jgi:quercetin dioxygenase-like cupin family protein